MDECCLNRNFYGTTNIQVVLRDEDGVVLGVKGFDNRGEQKDLQRTTKAHVAT